MSDYYIVIQLPEKLFNDPAFSDLEDALIDVLDGVADLDGHDIGSGQWNIFIETEKPNETFERACKYLLSIHLLDQARIGRRNTDEDDYTCLWPKGCSKFEIF